MADDLGTPLIARARLVELLDGAGDGLGHEELLGGGARRIRDANRRAAAQRDVASGERGLTSEEAFRLTHFYTLATVATANVMLIFAAAVLSAALPPLPLFAAQPAGPGFEPRRERDGPAGSAARVRA